MYKKINLLITHEVNIYDRKIISSQRSLLTQKRATEQAVCSKYLIYFTNNVKCLLFHFFDLPYIVQSETLYSAEHEIKIWRKYC